MNVDDFDNLIQNEDIQRLDVRTLADYSEGHIAKTININVMDYSFASMADSLLQKDKPVAVYCRLSLIHILIILLVFLLYYCYLIVFVGIRMQK